MPVDLEGLAEVASENKSSFIVLRPHQLLFLHNNLSAPPLLDFKNKSSMLQRLRPVRSIQHVRAHRKGL